MPIAILSLDWVLRWRRKQPCLVVRSAACANSPKSGVSSFISDIYRPLNPVAPQSARWRTLVARPKFSGNPPGRQPAAGFFKGYLPGAGVLSHRTHSRLTLLGVTPERPVHQPPPMQRQKRAVGGKPSGGFRNGLTLAEKPAERVAGGRVPVRPDIRFLKVEDRGPVADSRADISNPAEMGGPGSGCGVSAPRFAVGIVPGRRPRRTVGSVGSGATGRGSPPAGGSGLSGRFPSVAAGARSSRRRRVLDGRGRKRPLLLWKQVSHVFCAPQHPAEPLAATSDHARSETSYPQKLWITPTRTESCIVKWLILQRAKGRMYPTGVTVTPPHRDITPRRMVSSAHFL